MNVVVHYYVVGDHPSPVRMQEFAAVRQRLHYHAASCGVPVIEYHEGRPTFDTLLRKNALLDNINVCLNSDCYLTADSLYLVRNTKPMEALCLSRWELNTIDDEGEASAKLKESGAGSQDAWIFIGKLNNKDVDLSFSLGARGCDCRIASVFRENGYLIRNPSRTIRLMHYHTSRIRKWLPRVSGTYRQVPITTA